MNLNIKTREFLKGMGSAFDLTGSYFVVNQVGVKTTHPRTALNNEIIKMNKELESVSNEIIQQLYIKRKRKNSAVKHYV